MHSIFFVCFQFKSFVYRYFSQFYKRGFIVNINYSSPKLYFFTHFWGSITTFKHLIILAFALFASFRLTLLHMLPKIWIFDSYSIMLLLGLVAVFAIVEVYGKKRSLSRSLISSIEINGVVAVIFGLLGAILFQNLYDFIEDPSSYTWTWAMTFYGGLIFGVASFLIGYFLIIKKKYGPCMENYILIFAPSCIAIAQGFGRIGCFLAGCCYGRETDSWIGVQFPGMDSKVIPTNIMEAIYLLILGGLLIYISLSRISKWSFPIYLFGYSIWRFIIEFYRGDHRGDFIPGLSPSQFWSIVMFVIGAGYVVWLVIRSKKRDVESN